METVLQFFDSLGAWNWFLLSMLLLIMEAIVPGVHFMWFGMAAVVVGGLGLMLGEAFPWQYQLALFGVISVVSIWLTRYYWRPEAVESDEPLLNIRGAQYVGQIVTVETAIAGGRGRVKVGDTVWAARGADADAGAKVRIIGVDGTVLIVEPA